MKKKSKGRVPAFCEYCEDDKFNYKLTKEKYTHEINGTIYEFYEYVAYCPDCGEPLDVPGLIDINSDYMDKQYREKEGIISIKDIERCLSLYNISKDAFAKALGIGEATIHRYFKGQIPSKEYSERIKSVLYSAYVMDKFLEENKGELTSTAYKKAKEKTTTYMLIFADNEPKILAAVALLLEKMNEATQLQIQKLLYYCQGVFMGLYNKSMFEGNCQAWQYGPVFPGIYELLRDFSCNSIESDMLPLLQGFSDSLDKDERHTISLVAETFGNYSGSPLIRLTHTESPWIIARDGLTDDMKSHNIIEKKDIHDYFKSVNQKWGLSTKENINNYIKYRFESIEH